MTARPTRKRTWRKRITRAILCLLLGAVTTVGVAWGCAFAAYNTPGRRHAAFGRSTKGQQFLVIVEWHRGVTGVSLHINRTTNEQAEYRAGTPPAMLIDAAAATWALMPIDDFESTPLYAALPLRERLRFDAQQPVQSTIARTAGWPAAALWQAQDRVSEGAGWRWNHRGSIPQPWGEAGARLPLAPFFPGFLLDTLFYAAPWWLILITPGAIRRFRRRRRGRCIRCGYDLAGLRPDDNTTPTCPECGA